MVPMGFLRLLVLVVVFFLQIECCPAERGNVSIFCYNLAGLWWVVLHIDTLPLLISCFLLYWLWNKASIELSKKVKGRASCGDSPMVFSASCSSKGFRCVVGVGNIVWKAGQCFPGRVVPLSVSAGNLILRRFRRCADSSAVP